MAVLLSVDRFVLLNNFKPMFMQKCLLIIIPLCLPHVLFAIEFNTDLKQIVSRQQMFCQTDALPD